jgi:2,3-bisphosphoglycerate-independent phosphoglycerate mutase
MSFFPRPFLLIILDGFGYRQETEFNAVAAAKMPHWDYYWNHFPHMTLSGSGRCVGLPDSQMGNSEVGHLNIGSGRVIYQEFTRINRSIEDGSFFNNPTLLETLEMAKRKQSNIHLIGLLSPGGVHSHEQHFLAMTKLIAQQQQSPVYIHAFLDGRDTPPQSALPSLLLLDAALRTTNQGRVASIIGRYYAMDRDKRYDRVQKAYDLLTQSKADYTASSVSEALELAYHRGETDEFLLPTQIQNTGEEPALIGDDDVVIFMNFRADRARELSVAFTDASFSGFPRKIWPKLARFTTLTEYSTDLKAEVAFKPEKITNTLGEYLSHLGLKQLRIAETEKYAHVTFFFNGGIETPSAGETRVLIPSPKVATYDLKPEMSAPEITAALVKAIQDQEYDFIVCNFANPDMVGHTGNFPATVKALEVIDNSLGKILSALQNWGGEALITADHGNAEYMYDKKIQQPHTAHTSEPVPLLYVGRPAQNLQTTGCLSDIAPTLLSLMGIAIPKEMTGKVLFKTS